MLIPVLLFLVVGQTLGQMSTDPRLCGGYLRDIRGYIDFRFNELTAPPSVAQGKKFCMWTISPTQPSQYFRFNMTIQNVTLDCSAGDKIGVNHFSPSGDPADLGYPPTPGADNPLCIQQDAVWRREHINGTVIVVILYVEEVVYGKGFYLEWEEGYDSRLATQDARSTYYSWGRPSVAPNPYFAAGFQRNEISTFGFIKANYTDGYQMEMYFREIRFCEGSGQCFNNTISVYAVRDDCTLMEVQRYEYIPGASMTPPIASKNGFFIFVKIDGVYYAGGSFMMIFDTVGV